MSVDNFRLAWLIHFLMVATMPRQPSLGYFPRVNKAKEGHPITHSDAQAGGIAAGGGDGEHGQRIRRVEKEQVYNNIFHGHCRPRSLRLHRRRGRNGAAAPWPQVPTCQMDSHQHKQLRLFVLLMKRPLARICEGKRTARTEPPSRATLPGKEGQRAAGGRLHVRACSFSKTIKAPISVASSRERDSQDDLPVVPET